MTNLLIFATLVSGILTIPSPMDLPAGSLAHLKGSSEIVASTKGASKKGFLEKLFFCCGFDWNGDGVSRALEGNFATESIIENISKKNLNGHFRNPLAESIRYGRPKIMDALLANGADVKGSMKMSEFKKVYGVEDPIDVFIEENQNVEAIETDLVPLLKSFYEQYPSEFIERATGLISKCLRISKPGLSDKYVKTVALVAREFGLLFPVEGGIFEWVDYAFNAEREDTLVLIFETIIGDSKPGEERYTRIPARSLDKLTRVKELYGQVSPESLEQPAAERIQAINAKIKEIEALNAPKIQEIDHQISRLPAETKQLIQAIEGRDSEVDNHIAWLQNYHPSSQAYSGPNFGGYDPTTFATAKISFVCSS
jgi:hypothetical protein